MALYGLGFMREERLARAFQLEGQVVWSRPAEDTESWFNIFVLHQNRVQHYKQGPNSSARNVQERFLPDWLDLVRSATVPSPAPHCITGRNVTRASRLQISCARVSWGHAHASGVQHWPTRSQPRAGGLGARTRVGSASLSDKQPAACR